MGLPYWATLLDNRIRHVLRRRTGIGTGSCFTRATALQMQGDHDHRELYRLTSYQPLPAHRVTVTVSSWACCFYLRAGRRHASFVIILIIFEILDVTMCNTMSVIRASSDQAPPPNTATFTCCHSAFLNSLKSKTGFMVARATALRININTDCRPLPTKKRSNAHILRLPFELLSLANAVMNRHEPSHPCFIINGPRDHSGQHNIAT